jgi:hypothetical protein
MRSGMIEDLVEFEGGICVVKRRLGRVHLVGVPGVRYGVDIKNGKFKRFSEAEQYFFNNRDSG